MHTRALLRERSSAELMAVAARGELPAPADPAAAVNARLADLAPEIARLLHALAVLDDAWTDLPTAAAVGSVHDGAVAVLRDSTRPPSSPACGSRTPRSGPPSTR